MKKTILFIILSILLTGKAAFGYGGIDGYTVLMLHCDGQDGSASFTDSSFSNHPVTPYGNAQIDTAISKFGNAAALFGGNGDYLSIPSGNDWNFGAGDFTLDLWVRFNTMPAPPPVNYIPFISREIDGDNYWSFNMLRDDVNSYYLDFQVKASGILQARVLKSTPAFLTETWYHVALSRSGDTWKLFRDGTQIGSDYTSSYAIPDLADNMDVAKWKLGVAGGGPYYLNGYLDEVRISKGIARWTSNFTPPTEPYSTEPTVPEPATMLLFGIGGLAMAAIKRRKR